MTKMFLALCLLGTQLIANVPAQQPAATPTPAPQKPVAQSDADDVVRITTNLVQVDAVITDNNNKIVTDLKPEEIEIFEDGRQQKITHFSYNTVEGAAVSRDSRTARAEKPDKNVPPLPPSRLRPEQVRRTIALVVDDLGLSFVSTHYVRRALKKFVDEQMQPGDLVAIIRTSSGMGALQQFTADKRQLYAAIERVKFYLNGRANIGVFAPLQPPTPGEMGPVIDRANEEMDQFREDLFTVGTLGAVSYVVKGLRELPGRKSILLISDGITFFDVGDPNRNFRAGDKLRRLIDEAGRASVVIYTINASGLQTTGLTAADDTSGSDFSGASQLADVLASRSRELFNRQGGMDFLAQQTGGFAIKNYNDLSVGIHEVLEDQKGYYLIGYRPDRTTFDPRTGRRTFHHLSLKVTRKGKFKVRMRNGFFGVTDEVRVAPRTLAQQLFGALTSPFGADGVHLQLTSLFANDLKLGPIMRSLLHIDARDLTFTNEPNGAHKCVFDLLAMAFGDTGAAIDQVGRTYTIQLTDDQYKRALRDGLVYYMTVPIKKAGAYQFRISLRDSSSERIGSASQFIDAPDIKKKRLALSGLVVRGENRTAKSTLASAMTKAEGIEEGNAEASPAVRRFTRGMVMTYGYFIYNARVEKTSPTPQLVTQVKLFRDGQEVFVGKETPFDTSKQTDLTRLPFAGAIQLGSDMAPGDYVLQVVVRDLLADQKYRIATQWMDFQIVK
jgi:VWFA-related protein